MRPEPIPSFPLSRIPPHQGEVAAAEPPRSQRNGSPCRIMSKTRAEPLTEGVKAFGCGSRSAAAHLCGSWNRLTPSASLGSAPPPEGEESERGWFLAACACQLSL